jgi:SAM-dependent methyltransferase
MVTREEFFDNRDEKKWTDFAVFQREKHPMDKVVGLRFDAEEFYTFLEPRKNKGQLVVDFGCSTGLYRECFDGFDYIGIDQNLAAVEEARKRHPEDHFLLCQLNEVGEVYEDVICSASIGFFRTVLQHNHMDEAKEILDQVYRVLLPEALLLFTETTYNDYCWPPAERKKYNVPEFPPEYLGSVNDGGAIFTAAGWKNFLKECGFDVFFHDDKNCFAANKIE